MTHHGRGFNVYKASVMIAPVCSFVTNHTVRVRHYEAVILSDDRVVIVKKKSGQYSVILKQKDNELKFVEFTPNR